MFHPFLAGPVIRAIAGRADAGNRKAPSGAGPDERARVDEDGEKEGEMAGYSTILSEHDDWRNDEPYAYLKGARVTVSANQFGHSAGEALSIAFASIGRCVEARSAIDYVGSLLGAGDVTVHP